MQFLGLVGGAGVFLFILLGATLLMRATATPHTAKEIRKGNLIVDAHGREYIRPANRLWPKVISGAVVLAAIIIMLAVFFPDPNQIPYPPDPLTLLMYRKLEIM